MPSIDVDHGYQPHRWQMEIHQALARHRFAVLVCHRRFGKTFLAVNTLVGAAIQTRKDAARYAYVAPYLKQAKQVAWDYLKRFSRPFPGVAINESELAIDFPNGARIRLYGSRDGQDEALRGLYFDGVCLDEMADFSPETWPAIIRPALADRKGWMLAIGTPKGVNQFHELYQHAVNDPDWYAGLYRADETDLIDPGELEMSRAIMSENQYRQEWLCDFTASMDNVLITIDMVSAACARATIREAELDGFPKIIGVDVARFGDDRSVIQRRWGAVAFAPRVLQDVDNMHLAGLVAREIADWRPDAVFVDGGRGEGVIDRLRQLGHDVVEVQFGGKPINPRYADKRSEMWDLMARWVRETARLPNHAELKTDLCVPTYAYDAAGRMRLESKDKIKERGMRSPDLADALAVTFAFPVAPKTAIPGGVGRFRSEWDPTDADAE